jgi:hypothetical protein
MRRYELIALGMLLTGIAVSARAQDAMVQQKPVDKNQAIAGGDKADANGNRATAAGKLTDKSTDATITDPANAAANANAAKQ